MPSRVTIQAVFKLHQRVYDIEIHVTCERLRLNECGWVWRAVEFEARRSEVKRVMSSEVRAYLRALESCAGNREWLRSANTPTEKLSMAKIQAAFVALEDEIEGLGGLGNVSKHHLSLRTRALTVRYLRAAGFPKAERIGAFFKTRLLLERGKHRQLISDSVVSLGAESIPPVSALPHHDIADLRRRTHEALLRPLDAISDACRLTLDTCDRADAALQLIRAEPTDEHVVEQLLRFVLAGNKKPSAWVRSVPIDVLARAHLRVVERLSTEDLGPVRHEALGAKAVGAYLAARSGVAIGLGLVYVPVWLRVRPMLACLLLLQRHTKWNVNSVLELRSTWISSTTPPLEIQSFKSRTNTMTPIVAVERGDLDAARALAFLTRQLDAMKRLRWVPPDEERLWLYPYAARSGRLRQVIGWASALSFFCQEHRLPRFSFEQMRVQTLTAESVQDGGLRSALEAAGHKSLRTLSTYIDQLLARRLNSSINLEFQRRIEAEIVYSMEPDSSLPYPRSMLYPIGDGASCADPRNPPFSEYLEQGVCDGRRCHAGSGCPNVRLVINSERAEEVVRLSTYYRRNWARLIDQNRDAFLKQHLPNLTFNMALLGVLERGPHAHLVRDLHQKIEREAERA